MSVATKKLRSSAFFLWDDGAAHWTHPGRLIRPFRALPLRFVFPALVRPKLEYERAYRFVRCYSLRICELLENSLL